MLPSPHWKVFVITIGFFNLMQAQFDENSILTKETTYCVNNYYNWPQCIDKPTGYRCSCGPGFYWNTHTCISDAVDSRLEFQAPYLNALNRSEFAYSLLLGKPFPKLKEFTLALYVMPAKNSTQQYQAVFSYQYPRDKQFSLLIGKTIQIYVGVEVLNIDLSLDLKVWTHLALTWSKGEWTFFVNGSLHEKGTGFARKEVIQSDGFVVLGQSLPDSRNNYNLDFAYEGSLSHVNIWKNAMDASSITRLYNDCTFTHCGDGVEWVDFRVGTRGTSKLKWPSGIPVHSNNVCFTKAESESTCDKYCSHVIGIQCKKKIEKSLIWKRTRAGTKEDPKTLQVVCPGYEDVSNTTVPPMAYRTCDTVDDQGIWGIIHEDDCLSPFYLDFSKKIREYTAGRTFDRKFTVEVLQALANHTRVWSHDNPVDLTSAVGALAQLLDLQNQTVTDMMKSKTSLASSFAATHHDGVLDYSQSLQIAQLNLRIVDQLLGRRNDIAWNTSIPAGQEADKLLQVVQTMAGVIAYSLEYHLLNNDVTENNAVYRAMEENIGIKVQVIRRSAFYGFTFPEASDYGRTTIEDTGTVTFIPNRQEFENTNQRTVHQFLTVAVVRLSYLNRLLYNKDWRREDNVNAPVFAVHIYPDSETNVLSRNSSSTVRMEMKYSNNHNISDPRCMSVTHGDLWGLSQRQCKFVSTDTDKITCECTGYGFFTATTDMYNENWYTPPPPPTLMTLPSYLGCVISIIMCALTLGMLTYVGASSRTAMMHKHLAVASVFTTLSFMVGIGLTSNENVCKSFAIIFHYFFLCAYSWIMNEAFNLYISITYTAHNQNAQENSGHWRYYIIGWGIPAGIVAAVVGAKFDTYLAKDMCWISQENTWLFNGPPLAFVCVTLLVMTFAATENSEVSYTKNETQNKMTEYHSNGIWTQVILITCTWAFAFLSLRFETIVFKWVFFIFNSAQGFFMFVFFFLLNEEVRTVFKTKEIKQQLGWDAVDGDASPDSDDSIPLTSPGGTQHDFSMIDSPSIELTKSKWSSTNSTIRAPLATSSTFDRLTETSV